MNRDDIWSRARQYQQTPYRGRRPQVITEADEEKNHPREFTNLRDPDVDYTQYGHRRVGAQEDYIHVNQQPPQQFQPQPDGDYEEEDLNVGTFRTNHEWRQHNDYLIPYTTNSIPLHHSRVYGAMEDEVNFPNPHSIYMRNDVLSSLLQDTQDFHNQEIHNRMQNEVDTFFEAEEDMEENHAEEISTFDRRIRDQMLHRAEEYNPFCHLYSSRGTYIDENVVNPDDLEEEAATFAHRILNHGRRL
jgi:hypothetical protein